MHVVVTLDQSDPVDDGAGLADIAVAHFIDFPTASADAENVDLLE